MSTKTLPTLAFLAAVAGSALAADWPQWRGPDRNGVSKDTGLLQEWPEGGPKLRWKRTDIGPGYSTPIIVGGKVYLTTAVRHHIPLVSIVLNNSCHGAEKAQQQRLFGAKYIGVDLVNPRFDKLLKGTGLRAS